MNRRSYVHADSDGDERFESSGKVLHLRHESHVYNEQATEHIQNTIQANIMRGKYNQTRRPGIDMANRAELSSATVIQVSEHTVRVVIVYTGIEALVHQQDSNY